MMRRLVIWIGAAWWLVLLAVPLAAGRARPLDTDTVFVNNEAVAGGFHPHPHTYADIEKNLYFTQEQTGVAVPAPRTLNGIQLTTGRETLLWAVPAPTSHHILYATGGDPVLVRAYDRHQPDSVPVLERRYDSKLACSPLDPAWCLVYSTRIGRPVDLVNLDTLQTREYPAIWENPTWSPTALHFAAPNVTIHTGPRTVDDIEVVLINPLGGERKHVCRIGQSGRVYFNWSPDGRWLLVHATESLDRDDIPARSYLFPADYDAGGSCPRFASPGAVPPHAERQMLWATSSRALYLPYGNSAYVYTLADKRWRPLR